MNQTYFFLLVSTMSVIACVASAHAQNGNSAKQDERNENERVAKATAAVSDARKDLGDAYKELNAEIASQSKAVLSLQQLKRKLRETREEAEERLGAKIGIPEALAKVRQAGAVFEQIAMSIRESVRKSPEWIQSSKASELAKKNKANLLDDIEVSGKNNDKIIAELNHQILKPSELEDQAIAADANAKDASASLAEIQLELDKKRKLLPKGDVDRARKVVDATNEIDKQEKTIAAIELKLRKANSEFSKMQKRLSDANLSLQRAKAADAADPNRPKKNNGK